MPRKVKKEDNLAEVIFKYPKVAEVLLDYGLHCVGCAANSFDTIEMGAKLHGMSGTEIDEIV
ncbi:MAG: disulfide oxidoreductase, partial [Candidatus Moranbacteria bacterium CG_4_9_14_3_um_filter_42_9]